MAPVFPPRDACFAVFSQRPDARVDGAEWASHAERFLGTRMVLSEGDAPEPRFPLKVVLTPLRGKLADGGARACWGRPREEDDLRAARGAEGAGAGLAELAERCPQVWLVEPDARGEEDVVALRLAAILAGVMLGPILTPGGTWLFGPKTARERLGV
jgi:hypothetical protein